MLTSAYLSRNSTYHQLERPGVKSMGSVEPSGAVNPESGGGAPASTCAALSASYIFSMFRRFSLILFISS